MILWAAKTVAKSFFYFATTKFFKNSRIGNFLYSKFEKIGRWAANKYGVNILDKEQVKLAEKFPKLLKRIRALETKIAELEIKHDRDRSS